MSEQRLVYLDNNATTRVAPEVVEAMLPCLTEHWGNPSSAYSLAVEPARLIEKAREDASSYAARQVPVWTQERLLTANQPP